MGKSNMDVIKKLSKENDNRWIGIPNYSCLTCSHSFSTVDNKLICVIDKNHVEVKESNVCKNWN